MVDQQRYLQNLVHELEYDTTIHLSCDLVLQGHFYHKIPVETVPQDWILYAPRDEEVSQAAVLIGDSIGS